MPLDLDALTTAPRLLFEVPLRPLFGSTFQPTGFPDLGPATYQDADGTPCLLVESAQSMANRLENTIWDAGTDSVISAAEGLSHVRVTDGEGGKYLTSSITEAHRLNSPYILESKDKTFADLLKAELDVVADGPINRRLLAEKLLRFDANSLLHGVFLAKKDLAGGRLRVARALTAMVEARGVGLAASGGVKNDHVNPSGEAAKGFGNVPFARDEFTAVEITASFCLDLQQLRAYGLGEEATTLLITLALFKVRALLDGDLRFRTRCDLKVAGDEPVTARLPEGFELPAREALEPALKEAIAAVGDAMTTQTVAFTS